MNDHDEGMPCSVQLAIMIIGAVLVMAAMGEILPDRGGTRTTTSRTETNVDVLSGNEIRILSPDTYIYYNSGDTSQVVSGDRNQVAPPPPAGQCWISSAGAWGTCPEWAAAGSAVP